MDNKCILFFIFIANAVAQDRSTITSTRELCRKNNAEDLFEDAEIALNDFIENFFKLFELNDLNPDQNHCKKAATLQRHLENLAQGMAPCISSDDGGYDYSITRTGVVLVLNYMCSKDGEELKVNTNYSRTCFKENLIKCVTDMKNIPVSKAALSLSVNDPCGNFNQMSACVATAIDHCSINSDKVKQSTSCCKYYGSCEKT